MRPNETLSFDPDDLSEGFYTVAELAELLRSSPVTIYRQYERKLLPGTKLCGRIIFSRKMIAAWLSAHSSGPAPAKREGEGWRP